MAELIHGLQLFLQSNFPLLQIQLTDILDIAILSFVIYKLMWMLRKTSSGRLMWGVLILMTVMFLSSDNVLSLTATSFVLDKLVQWGIVVLVILFQEIRRFLERMGSGRLGMVFAANKEPGQDMETAIIQTTEAYTDLSRDKVGALMVFERQNLLDDVIKTGTELDCSVSSELLKNIFWNKAPLHDGAVIVRDGRIVGAGCHRHERTLRRRGGHRLGGDRLHFRRRGRDAQAAPGPGDSGTAAAQRAAQRQAGGEEGELSAPAGSAAGGGQERGG